MISRISSPLLWSEVALPYSAFWSGSFPSTDHNVMDFYDRFITVSLERGEHIFVEKKRHCLLLHKGMNPCLFHIHWSNSGPTAAEVVICDYHSIMSAIQRLLESWRPRAYLTSERHDRLEPGPSWLLQNCQASKRFWTKLISTILPHSYHSTPFSISLLQIYQFKCDWNPEYSRKLWTLFPLIILMPFCISHVL